MLMTSKDDIARSARTLVLRHGAEAPSILEREAADLGRRGDLREQDRTYLILNEVERLLSSTLRH
ncbi:MAG: hypothetical protein ACM31L_11580 [Actinomycetota bacterium]